MRDTIAVYALWRDSEPHIQRTLSQLEDLESLDYNFEYYFYENDSKDDTVIILNKWLKGRSGKFSHETLSAKKFGSVADSDRMFLLSESRNKCKKLGQHSKSKYSLLIDSDIVFDKHNLELHLQDINRLSNVAMVTPNVRQDIPDLVYGDSEDSYYDILPFWDRFKSNGLAWADCPFRNGIDKMNWSLGEPIKCLSAFGGFCLIKSSIFDKVKWSTSGNSEHINFCQEINDFGDIYICPKNTVKTYIADSDKNINIFSKIAYQRLMNPKHIDFEIFTPKDYSDLSRINNAKDRTSFLKSLFLKKNTTQEEKLKILKNSFKGFKSTLISCGPSLGDQDKNKLNELLGSTLVLSIKQSFDLFSEFVDFHFYNCANYKKYDYSIYKPIVFEASTVVGGLGNADLLFKIPQGMDYDKSLCREKNINDWTLEKEPYNRCYGPGIEYEIVFFAVHHLGVSELTTIGWDNKLINNGHPDKQHFYDKDKGSNDKWIQKNKVSSSSHSSNLLEFEEKITSDFIIDFSDWLLQNDCKLKIVSKLNPAPEYLKTNL